MRDDFQRRPHKICITRPSANPQLSARSPRRIPAIASILDIPDIRVVPAVAAIATILNIPNIRVVPAVPASSIGGCVRRRAGGGGRGCRLRGRITIGNCAGRRGLSSLGCKLRGRITIADCAGRPGLSSLGDCGGAHGLSGLRRKIHVGRSRRVRRRRRVHRHKCFFLLAGIIRKDRLAGKRSQSAGFAELRSGEKIESYGAAKGRESELDSVSNSSMNIGGPPHRCR
jgi:hypothetical protein